MRSRREDPRAARGGRAMTASRQADGREWGQYAYRRAWRRIRRRGDCAAPREGPAAARKCRHHTREPRELLRDHAAAVRGVFRPVGTPTLRAAHSCRTSTSPSIEANVESVDVERQVVRAMGPEGRAHDLPYDHLVIA